MKHNVKHITSSCLYGEYEATAKSQLAQLSIKTGKRGKYPAWLSTKRINLWFCVLVIARLPGNQQRLQEVIVLAQEQSGINRTTNNYLYLWIKPTKYLVLISKLKRCQQVDFVNCVIDHIYTAAMFLLHHAQVRNGMVRSHS